MRWRKDSGELVFVDVRDIREIEKSDTITGSHHAPRGMIEFWFDPESPYYRDIYGEKDKTYVLFCNGNRARPLRQSAEGYGHRECRAARRWYAGLARCHDPTEENHGNKRPSLSSSSTPTTSRKASTAPLPRRRGRRFSRTDMKSASPVSMQWISTRSPTGETSKASATRTI